MKLANFVLLLLLQSSLIAVAFADQYAGAAAPAVYAGAAAPAPAVYGGAAAPAPAPAVYAGAAAPVAAVPVAGGGGGGGYGGGGGAAPAPAAPTPNTRRPVCSGDDASVCRRVDLCHRREKFLTRRLFRCVEENCQRRHLALLSPVRRACKRLHVECKLFRSASKVRFELREIQERIESCDTDTCVAPLVQVAERLEQRVAVMRQHCLHSLHARGATLALERWSLELVRCGADAECSTRAKTMMDRLQIILKESREGLLEIVRRRDAEWKESVKLYSERKCAARDCACACEKTARVAFFQSLLDESDRRHKSQAALMEYRKALDKARFDFRHCRGDECRAAARERVHTLRLRIRAVIVSSMERSRLAYAAIVDKLSNDQSCKPSYCGRVTRFVIEELTVKVDKYTPTPCDCKSKVALMEKREAQLLKEADMRLAACGYSEECRARLQVAVEHIKSQVAVARAECDDYETTTTTTTTGTTSTTSTTSSSSSSSSTSTDSTGSTTTTTTTSTSTTTATPPPVTTTPPPPPQTCSQLCRSPDEECVFQCFKTCNDTNPQPPACLVVSSTTTPNETTPPSRFFVVLPKKSSSAVNVGLIVGVVVGAAVAAGILAVAIGFFLTSSAATGAAPLTQSLMTSAHTSPLYMAEVNQGSNPLF